jgi:phenylacetate-CoA ligase
VSDQLLRIYSHLPGPMRSIAANLRGMYLRSWRYGPETHRLVEEALEHDTWSPERWKLWRDERLPYILRRAATQVPYYREQWMARRRRGDSSSWEVLENWPVLDKESLREHPEAFVADGCDVRRMFPERSSGTSGKPVRVWRDRRTVRAAYALSAARERIWYGVSRRDRWAMLGGQLITPARQRKPPFWLWNQALNQLYMSSYHLAPNLLPYYLDALARHRVVYLLGYTSSLSVLAGELLRQGRRDLKMKVVITNAEPLFDHQRQTIEEAFQCPVRETYGMTELVAAASECAAGRLHQWPEVGWVEVLEGNQPVATGTLGDFVCTGLLNADMPLIRYRIGDCGRLSADNHICDCGRTLPSIERVEGRTNDMLVTRDGRSVYWLNPIFYDVPVREAQIVQDSLDHIRVRYVPAPAFSAEAGRCIVRRLQERMGHVVVSLEEIDELPRGPNGKFKAVICDLPPAQKRAALAAQGRERLSTNVH